MATILPNKLACVVMDANIMIALCAKEPLRFVALTAEVENYARAGSLFYAPNIIVGESLYALRRKLTDGVLSATEYAQSVSDFQVFMRSAFPPPTSEASLVLRADQICDGYGCSRSADALYIALAEELSQTYTTRLLTFDQGLPKQATHHAPLVTIHLLT